MGGRKREKMAKKNKFIKTTAELLGKIHIEDVDKLYPIAQKELKDGSKLYIYGLISWYGLLVGKNKKSLKIVIVKEDFNDNYERDGYFEYTEYYNDNSNNERIHWLSEFKTIPENYEKYRKEENEKEE